MTDATQKIVPYLWFHNQAEEAVDFYVSLFDDAKIGDVIRYDEASADASGQPEGSVMTVKYQLAGQQFVALNGGPHFNFTPAISFFVSCDTEEEVDRLWEQLSAGGETLMPFQKYPFANKFGWTNDRYGVSWQLNLAPAPQKIVPFLMFVGDQHGKAEQAIDFYTALFDNAETFALQRYGPGGDEPEGTVMHAAFSLAGQQFMAMDSAREHDFTFTEAISFLVNCHDQDEVDRLWQTFTTDGEEGQCGWLKDPFGVSWQIVPTALFRLLNDPDAEKARRVMEAMLQMKKIDLSALQEARQAE